MLSDRVIREINEQIESELREVKMAFDQDEKLAAIERINALKNVLQPQPTREELIAELAQAIVDAKPSTPSETAADILGDLYTRFRR